MDKIKTNPKENWNFFIFPKMLISFRQLNKQSKAMSSRKINIKKCSDRAVKWLSLASIKPAKKQNMLYDKQLVRWNAHRWLLSFSKKAYVTYE